jgi:hypothetical protein
MHCKSRIVVKYDIVQGTILINNLVKGTIQRKLTGIESDRN